MSSKSLATLPTTGDMDHWTQQEKDLAGFVGMVVKIRDETIVAPSGVREAFLIAVNRTQLDPIARQIYLAFIGGKWLIIVSIDGFRLIAQRSHEYRGQTAPEWTDGVKYAQPYMVNGAPMVVDGNLVMGPPEFQWHEVWVDDEPPAAARVGVYREGFTEPLYGIATWKAYGKEGGGKKDGQWEKNGPHMLAIRAEAQALRKAFPMELSGLYTVEEFNEDNDEMVASSGRDWAKEAKETKDVDKLAELYNEMKESGEWTKALDAEFRTRKGSLMANKEDETIVVKEKANV